MEVKARARPVGRVVSVSAGLNESVSSVKVVISVGTLQRPMLVRPTVTLVVVEASNVISNLLILVNWLPIWSSPVRLCYSVCA